MKRRPLFIIVAACIVGAIIGLLLWPSKREPEYKGVALITWLRRGTLSRNQAEADPALVALRHMGTNALPFLIRWIQYEPGWQDSLGRKILSWPVLGNRGAVQRLIWNTTQYRANAAVNGFLVLGSQANPALPELQRLADNPKAPETARRATQCLILMTQRFPDFDDVLR